MAKETYFWGDQHFRHSNAYKFPSKDGDRKMRPFNTMEECELLMVENYNKIVKDDDIVYFLGDVILDKKGAQILSFMKKGAKHLILGNHDNKGDVSFYRQYFDKIYGVLYLPKLKSILSHVPVHNSFLGPQDYLEGEVRFEYNVHGHCHDNHILLSNSSIKDSRYLNTCVEVVDYKPVTFEQLIEINKLC
jgi:calcineurin-like phosphoesterase family protein